MAILIFKSLGGSFDSRIGTKTLREQAKLCKVIVDQVFSL